MSKPRIIVTLESDERSALMRLASAERRTDREQAALILRWALQELGYLQPQPQQPQVRILEGVYCEPQHQRTRAGATVPPPPPPPPPDPDPETPPPPPDPRPPLFTEGERATLRLALDILRNKLEG
jgi:hypothetical protein